MTFGVGLACSLTLCVVHLVSRVPRNCGACSLLPGIWQVTFANTVTQTLILQSKDFVLNLRPFCCCVVLSSLYPHSCCWPADDLQDSSVTLALRISNGLPASENTSAFLCEDCNTWGFLVWVYNVSVPWFHSWVVFNYILVTVIGWPHHVRESMLVGAASCYGVRIVWQLIVARHQPGTREVSFKPDRSIAHKPHSTQLLCLPAMPYV